MLVRGAGDLATGVAMRLYRAGFAVVMTELAQPMVVRRTASLADAVTEGRWRVEELVGVRATAGDAPQALGRGEVPVLIDPGKDAIRQLAPRVVVDGIMAKRNTGTGREDAPIVIALGPGFTAGADVDAVIETARGHELGRAIYGGSAQPNTGVPGEVGGASTDRLLRAPVDGVFRAWRQIGDRVAVGEAVADVDGVPVKALLDGILRGLLRTGTPVTTGLKVGDVDPRAEREYCFTVSDKALAIGGGALEAILRLWPGRRPPA